MKITFAVPEVTTSTFIVAVERVPSDLQAVIPWRMPRPHRRAAARALGTPRLEITVTPAEETVAPPGGTPPSPPRPGRWHEGENAGPHRRQGDGRDGPPWKREEYGGPRRGRRHIVVSSTAPLAAQPEAAQAARAAARALAAACRGTLVDALTGQVISLSYDHPAERERFHLADDWLAWQTETDPGAPHGSGGPAGPGGLPGDVARLRVTSRGLARFGLPELLLDGVSHAHHRCAVNLLRLVAHRLVTGQLSWVGSMTSPGPVTDGRLAARRTVRTIADRLTLSGTDVTAFWHVPPPGPGFPGHGLPGHGSHDAGWPPDGDGWPPDGEPHGPVAYGPEAYDLRPFQVRLVRRQEEHLRLEVVPPEGSMARSGDWPCRLPTARHTRHARYGRPVVA